MKIRTLGTAAAEAIPGIFCNCETCAHARAHGGKNIRTRSQTIINDKYLVDFPMDAYMHSINFGINFFDINHILITHPHEDHFYPHDIELRCPPYAHGQEGKLLNVYGPGSIGQLFPDFPSKRNQDYIRFHKLNAFETYSIDELQVTPMTALHSRDFECFVYLIEHEGKKLLYGHDSGFFPQDTMNYLKNSIVDCVLCDTTFGKNLDGDNHMGVEDNIQLRKIMVEQGSADENTKFILTHLSHNGGLTHEQLEQTAENNGFLAAYDGFELEF
ncbi:MAG: hypothetical protein GX815_06105 [Clostridiales bacterium]|nr:hypothetical protein [Clostridiales bacterium]